MRVAGRASSRLILLAAAAFVLALVTSSVARADARVTHSDGQLTVEVLPPDGAPVGHGFIVESFTDLTRNGFRVRQDRFGRPTFTTSDNDCFHNSIFNDVVCNGGRGSVRVVGGGGDDLVVGMEQPNGAAPSSDQITLTIVIFGFGFEIPLSAELAGDVSCVEFGLPGPVPFEVSLGAGADVLAFAPQLSCPLGTLPANVFSPRFVANGGGGNDRMGGGRNSDELNGGAGNDTVVGGDGEDMLNGGGGADTLAGEDGDDTLIGGTGGDVIGGGGGLDTVTYASATASVQVRIDGQANDGVFTNGASEGDAVQSSVERVLGGSGDDVLIGNAAAQEFFGNEGSDSLSGGDGDDRLTGGNDRSDGGDELAGGGGTDVFRGGAGNDFIEARDGIRELPRCGPGLDTAFIDLQDGLLVGHSCDFVEEAPVDDGPPSHALRRPVSVRGGTALVSLLCPRNARVACRGTMTLRRSAGGAVLGRAGYRIGLGRTVVVSLPLRGSVGARVLVETRERGVSRKGPRSSSYLLPVSRR